MNFLKIVSRGSMIALYVHKFSKYILFKSKAPKHDRQKLFLYLGVILLFLWEHVTRRQPGLHLKLKQLQVHLRMHHITLLLPSAGQNILILAIDRLTTWLLKNLSHDPLSISILSVYCPVASVFPFFVKLKAKILKGSSPFQETISVVIH